MGWAVRMIAVQRATRKRTTRTASPRSLRQRVTWGWTSGGSWASKMSGFLLARATTEQGGSASTSWAWKASAGTAASVKAARIHDRIRRTRNHGLKREGVKWLGSTR